MKTYLGNFAGVVINNNDPEFRGRVQVFIPHLMPTLYENWNKEGKDITFTCVGDNMPEGLGSEIIEKLKKILPWAESASPIIGQSASGNVLGANGAVPTGSGQFTDEKLRDSSFFDQSPTSEPTQSKLFQNIGGTSLVTSPQALSSPSTVPAVSTPQNANYTIKQQSQVDSVNLQPLFKQRLESFTQEATKMGYDSTLVGGYRNSEKQFAFYEAIKDKTALAPRESPHEVGIAADMSFVGPGVNITKMSSEASANGQNYDTPQFRALLKKHLLHQPFHPDTATTTPEHWHIEPIETPVNPTKRTYEQFLNLSKKMSNQNLNGSGFSIGLEKVNSSQFPAADNPLAVSNPGETATTYSKIPTTL